MHWVMVVMHTDHHQVGSIRKVAIAELSSLLIHIYTASSSQDDDKYEIQKTRETPKNRKKLWIEYSKSDLASGVMRLIGGSIVALARFVPT